ncbi:precorrin-6y C5,15-methyltransferase (decarboxylating) subunit CbiE [Rhodoblastus acidophilus]|uniref:Precorrin-6y C5,15-methyltransferase (Decarboxylating) subunit CbiE n=1 Tax=Rhodoblastus acidophilus TaxID=1074 RepID=A0A6N8DPS9_RHOAC|nr:precorrin-6y C5,15-methyltransferase (decarboxylating) subunit CbiE [Rhodoblastus acidophilus]MCW2274624.1 precorrin-6Y C5,15-methyltransferase (decarboxylating) [Rhodoblastus acidophilus]MTV32570.1 precorrin-6y C5,15-methyltransferase (decarboxylating) subunit CbiE [Rhodoblastus acidophilus]
MSAPWLTIVGLGEDGLQGLSLAARERIAQARLVVGGARHLQLIGETAGERLAWPSPLQEAFPRILARRGEPVAVLASGDPFFFGVGSLLAQIVPPADILCLPQPSAFSLAASRLGWALQDCALVTLHGRALEKILSHLQPGAKILALSWDGETPGKLAALLRERGLGASKLTVCEAMGGPRELLRTAPADGFDIQGIDPLNTIALEVLGDGVRIPPKTPGLPDDWFEHDGQITKREMRALTLSQLAPRPRDLLWDVGAGSGSISIEWLLLDPSTRALAIEKNPERCARIRRNAASLGVPHLTLVEGEAPDALHGLEQPNAIFVGGGFTAPGLIDLCWSALAPRGRLVVNAVTLESQADLFAAQRRFGGELVQCQFAHADAVGRFRGFRPLMPSVQWSVTK